VGRYNESLELMVLKGWTKIRERIAQGSYFDDKFYHYVVDRYVADSLSATGPEATAQSFLNMGKAELDLPIGTHRSDFGICESKQYCLGYTRMFQPMKPRLTDMLLALIAAKDPVTAIRETIDAAQGSSDGYDSLSCEDKSLTREGRARCQRLWKELDLTDRPMWKKKDPNEIKKQDPKKQDPKKQDPKKQDPHESRDCEKEDLRLILGSAFNKAPDGFGTERVYLSCFRKEADRLLQPADPNFPTSSPSGIGLMRAAIANFLFNYKSSQRYPHEFDAYYLSQSADALNTALSPLIDAFNRDIATFQRFVRADVLYEVELINKHYDPRCCAKRLFGLDKPSFFNEGIVSVRTTSGQTATVNTTSQSSVNASAAPQLSGLLSSLAGLPSSSAVPPASGSGSTSQASGQSGGGQNSPTALLSALISGNSQLESVKLAAAFLSAYQTTFVQIGRALTITAMPRSLATASSAEISVTLNADESATPPTFSSGPVNDPTANLSRVASHDTSTTVRVESVKLFEVSSFAAVLQRSRSRLPLIPPFVELPYIGTIAGIPLPPGKEYHQSTAILSAVVVPTAADIAYGLEFEDDHLVDAEKTCTLGTPTCKFRRALSIQDFGTAVSLTRFNRAMVHCLSTDMRSAQSSINALLPINDPARKSATINCDNLSFDNVP